MKKFEPPFLRTPHNYDRNEISDATALKCLDESLAQQQFKDESDINTIVERFHLTGTVPTPEHLPTYGDFTGIFDYQSAMNVLNAARDTFMTLPANMRAQFNNDPAAFVDFCDKDENQEKLRDMGLLSPEANARIDKTRNDQAEAKIAQAVSERLAEASKTTGDTPLPPKPVKKT